MLPAATRSRSRSHSLKVERSVKLLSLISHRDNRKAKRLCEEMKTAKQFQSKFLQKHIDVCEAANSLCNNFSELNNHAVDVSVTLLLDKSVAIPWSIQLRVTEKKLHFVFEELAAAPDLKLPDLTDRVLDMICAWKHVSHPVRHEEDDDEDTSKMKEESVTWSAKRCSFDLLWMELEADIRETSSEDTEECAKLVAKAEAPEFPVVSCISCSASIKSLF